MPNELLLDTRELEAPLPMSLVLENIENLSATTYIKMVHRIEPLMLYTFLLNNNIHYKVSHKNEDFHIYIWNNSFTHTNIFKDII